MKKNYLNIFLTLILLTGIFFLNKQHQTGGAPPYGEPEESAPSIDRYLWPLDWQRPSGPAKVVLQVGHWQNDRLPEELSRLRGNTGASFGETVEWQVNLEIARQAAALLKKRGVEVEILPSTVPPDYWADVFVAIHADGSLDWRKSGFKVASPWRDMTGRADDLVALIRGHYQNETGLEWDENISQNMRGYYAFSWWRYRHSVHPMTTAVIVETGFLTNYSDRKLLVNQPELSAAGIVNGVLAYLLEQKLL